MILYLLKSTCCMAIFLGLYHLLLEREKMHHFKRFYLLISLIAALIIPLWVVHTTYLEVPGLPDSGSSLSPLIQDSKVVPSDSRVSLGIAQLLWGLYVIGLMVMSVRFGKNIWQMYTLIRRNPKQKLTGAHLILYDGSSPAFSFLNYIFLKRQAYEKPETRELLIAHEQAHVSQKHSLDILLMELIQCFYWFNPLLPYYKKAIRLNHEYLADESVLRQTDTPATYMHLLISLAGPNRSASLVTSLNYGQTLKRLNMMNSQAKTTHNRLRQLSTLLMFFCLIITFGKTQTIRKATKPVQATDSQTESADPGKLQYELHDFDGGMLAYEVVQHGESYKGRTRVSKVHGQTIRWRVYVVVRGNEKVSFTNPQGERVEKIARELDDAERHWFWKLEQSQAQVLRMPHGKNLPRPTGSQLKDFQNPAEYGVWLDGVRIQNGELQNYKAEDFQSVFISSLERNAAHYGQYNYHVSLETKKAFDVKYAGREGGWWEEVRL